MVATEIKANNSPTKLRDPGTLILIKSKNTNSKRKLQSIMNIESINLEYVLLINKPANKNKLIEEKLCANEIMIPLSNPHALNDKHETKARFKCKIEENAMIFFKSKYRKQEDAIIITPINVIKDRHNEKNCNDKKNVDKMNLDKQWILSFSINPANNKEIEELDSLCTSGNQ